MPEPALAPSTPGSPLGHPALQAWLDLQGRDGAPEDVAIGTVRCKPKSTVYRLEGVGLGGSDVIAKRCRRATAWIEHTVYVDVLPHLSLTALHCYGLVEEGDGQFCWLFLEDAGEERYSPECADQRALAGRWLGVLHTSAAHVGAVARLPDRGPGRYLEHLRSARDTVRGNVTNPALATEDRELLERVVSCCNFLEARWDQVQRACEDMPRTLVHGDCVAKNVRVRRGPAGLALLPLDWEMAGWGVPAPDLVQPTAGRHVPSLNADLDAYWSVVRESWPHLGVQDLRRWGDWGRLFRLLAKTDWVSGRLAYPWVSKPVAELRLYQEQMAGALQAVGWAN
jgi:hypothetical protein